MLPEDKSVDGAVLVHAVLLQCNAGLAVTPVLFCRWLYRLSQTLHMFMLWMSFTLSLFHSPHGRTLTAAIAVCDVRRTFLKTQKNFKDQVVDKALT